VVLVAGDILQQYQFVQFVVTNCVSDIKNL
jgi:hypothetical protein